MLVEDSMPFKYSAPRSLKNILASPDNDDEHLLLTSILDKSYEVNVESPGYQIEELDD